MVFTFCREKAFVSVRKNTIVAFAQKICPHCGTTYGAPSAEDALRGWEFDMQAAIAKNRWRVKSVKVREPIRRCPNCFLSGYFDPSDKQVYILPAEKRHKQTAQNVW